MENQTTETNKKSEWNMDKLYPPTPSDPWGIGIDDYWEEKLAIEGPPFDMWDHTRCW